MNEKVTEKAAQEVPVGGPSKFEMALILTEAAGKLLDEYMAEAESQATLDADVDTDPAQPDPTGQPKCAGLCAGHPGHPSFVNTGKTLVTPESFLALLVDFAFVLPLELRGDFINLLNKAPL